MTRPNATTLPADLVTLYTLGVGEDLSDCRLVDRFLSSQGNEREAAFRILVDRHWPMVLRTCFGVLRDRHEAQDAAQLAFSTLARRASGLRRRESLAPWLHRVAFRVACRIRSEAARRADLERRAAGMIRTTDTPAPYDDSAGALHREIDRLPARYRSAILACHLEGLSHAAAAARLSIPERTLETRLRRGRERLRKGLVKRGFELVVLERLAHNGVEAAVGMPWPELAAGFTARCSTASVASGRLSPLLGAVAIAASTVLIAVVAMRSGTAAPDQGLGQDVAATAPVPEAIADYEEIRRVLRQVAAEAAELAEPDLGAYVSELGRIAFAQATAGDREGARDTFAKAEGFTSPMQKHAVGASLPNGQSVLALARREIAAGFQDRGKELIGKALQAAPEHPESEGLMSAYLTDAIALLDDPTTRAEVFPKIRRLWPPTLATHWTSTKVRREPAIGVRLTAALGNLETAIREVDGKLKEIRRPEPELRGQLLGRAARQAATLRPDETRAFVRRLEEELPKLEEKGRMILQGDLLPAMARIGEVAPACKLARRVAEARVLGDDPIDVQESRWLGEIALARRRVDDFVGAAAVYRLASNALIRDPNSSHLTHFGGPLAYDQLRAGDPEGALRTVEAMPEGGRHPSLLLGIARDLPAFGMRDEAGRAREMARAILLTDWRGRVSRPPVLQSRIEWDALEQDDEAARVVLLYRDIPFFPQFLKLSTILELARLNAFAGDGKEAEFERSRIRNYLATTRRNLGKYYRRRSLIDWLVFDGKFEVAEDKIRDPELEGREHLMADLISCLAATREAARALEVARQVQPESFRLYTFGVLADGLAARLTRDAAIQARLKDRAAQ